jgi:hypothetical protein
MKQRLLFRIGQQLTRISPLRICIIDDEETYFNEMMLKAAAAAGFPNIERHYKVDMKLFTELMEKPPDIIILDIRGITDDNVGSDGWDIAMALYNKSNCYVVITSAHSYQIGHSHKYYDYQINNRLLTAVDFINELHKIIDDYINIKIRFYKKIMFKFGYHLVKKALL